MPSFAVWVLVIAVASAHDGGGKKKRGKRAPPQPPAVTAPAIPAAVAPDVPPAPAAPSPAAAQPAARQDTTPPDAEQDRSVLVMQLEAKTGVKRETAELLTENMVTEVRRSRAFTKVVSMSELEAAIGHEQRKQLMNCNSESCMGDIANTMSVKFLLNGSLGRLGNSYVLNMKLVNVGGLALSSVTQRVSGASEESLLDAVRPAVDTLVRDAGFSALSKLAASSSGSGPGKAIPPAAVGAQPPPETAPAEESTQANPRQAASGADGDEGKKGGVMRWVVAGLGAASALPAVGLGVAGGVALALGGWLVESLYVGAVPFIIHGVRPQARMGLAAAGGGGGAALVVLGILLAAAGASALGVGLVVLK